MCVVLAHQILDEFLGLQALQKAKQETVDFLTKPPQACSQSQEVVGVLATAKPHSAVNGPPCRGAKPEAVALTREVDRPTETETQ